MCGGGVSRRGHSDPGRRETIMNAKELYDAGQLDEALSAASDEVKRHPTDLARREFLCELLCFAGELERADKQLDAMNAQQPDAALGISLFRQLIRAEKARQGFFAEGWGSSFNLSVGP